MANEPDKLPKRRANTWPLLMERVDGTYDALLCLPSWKVTRCTASKDGGYLVRLVPVEGTIIEAVFLKPKDV